MVPSRVILVVVAVALAGCAPRVPLAPTGTHEGDIPELVPYPPPPARVEMIPAQPDADAVWMDGTWIWTGARYEWSPGRWQRPTPGAYHAPASTVRRRNGKLVYFPGVWHARR